MPQCDVPSPHLTMRRPVHHIGSGQVEKGNATSALGSHESAVTATITYGLVLLLAGTNRKGSKTDG